MRFDRVRWRLHRDVWIQGEDIVFRGAIDVLSHEVTTQFASSDHDYVFSCIEVGQGLERNGDGGHTHCQ